MAGELLPIVAELLRRGLSAGLKVTTSDEREGVLLEVEQEGLAWLVGEDGTVYCERCGYTPVTRPENWATPGSVPDACECDG